MYVQKLKVPLTESEFDLLMQIAETDLRSPAQTMRWLLHEEVKRRSLNDQPQPEPTPPATEPVA